MLSLDIIALAIFEHPTRGAAAADDTALSDKHSGSDCTRRAERLTLRPRLREACFKCREIYPRELSCRLRFPTRKLTWEEVASIVEGFTLENWGAGIRFPSDVHSEIDCSCGKKQVVMVTRSQVGLQVTVGHQLA
jgi:hypothetical protein